MSLKFHQNRSVTRTYAKVPMYYTGVKHPNYPHKELVVMDQLGPNYAVCWKNHNTCRVGIQVLAPIVNPRGDFEFKGKVIDLSTCNRVL